MLSALANSAKCWAVAFSSSADDARPVILNDLIFLDFDAIRGQKVSKEQVEQILEYERRVPQVEDELVSEGSKSNGYQRELRELSEKLSELNAKLKKEVEEKKQLGIKAVDAEKKVTSSNGKRVSELEAELEVVQLRASSLEVALQASKEKEKELNELLNVASEENKNLKDATKASNKNLEILLKVLRDELNILLHKWESTEMTTLRLLG
ncbi:hypothetical protein BUALT_Bualt03G0217600 [Buddleja alternifolia]|uniref:Uncharacterized protein n=1 Tax=Buddleja alternifolia TaxID=168488 RepID=A0AAV6Y2Z9_9LAMI|nr:hypothetical protein BUALT_Bualt03G0217600 [Buddleja alternifolia]